MLYQKNIICKNNLDIGQNSFCYLILMWTDKHNKTWEVFPIFFHTHPQDKQKCTKCLEYKIVLSMGTKVDLEIYLPNYFLFRTQFAKIITAENQIIQQYKFYNFHILDYKGKTKWHLVNDVKSTIVFLFRSLYQHVLGGYFGVFSNTHCSLCYRWL